MFLSLFLSFFKLSFLKVFMKHQEKCSIVGNLSQELDFWFDSCCKMLVNITLENFSLMLKDPAVSLVPFDLLFLLRI